MSVGEIIADVGNTSKLAIYSTFKREFEPERYLNFKIIKSHRQALSGLRYFSVTNCGRATETHVNDR